MYLIEPSVMRLQIDNYFEQVLVHKQFQVGEVIYPEESPTITGIALFLGFSTVGGMLRLADDPRYAENIEYAKLRVENRYEQLLQKNVSTAKIGLKKVGEGWSDDASISHTFNFGDMAVERMQSIRNAVIADSEAGCNGATNESG